MKRWILIALALALSLIATGCTASYQGVYMKQTPNYVYYPARFLLVTPVNGMYGDIIYPTSGNDVIQALIRELQRYTNAISTIPVPVTIEQIYPQDLERTDYVVIPQILHWEDRATGWSFRPDRIEVRFDIFDNQRHLIDSYNIRGRSAYIVWFSRQPNSLLPRPIRNMLQDLFNRHQ